MLCEDFSAFGLASSGELQVVCGASLCLRGTAQTKLEDRTGLRRESLFKRVSVLFFRHRGVLGLKQGNNMVTLSLKNVNPGDTQYMDYNENHQNHLEGLLNQCFTNPRVFSGLETIL